MSQTQEDGLDDALEEAVTETKPTTDTNTPNTKVLRKRKATTVLRQRIKRNKTIHKKTSTKERR